MMVPVPLGFPALDLRAQAPLRAGAAWALCVILAACPSALLCTQLCSDSTPWPCSRHSGEQEESQPCALLGCSGPGPPQGEQLWCRAMEQPRGMPHFRTHCKHPPRRERALGCLGHAFHCAALPVIPAGSLDQETGMQ